MPLDEIVVKDAEGLSQDTPAQEPSPEPEGAPQDKRGPDGWIPKVRFNEVLDERNELRARVEQEREERIRLEERARAQDAAVEAKRKQAPTMAELDDMVARGELTSATADVYKHRQTEDNAVAKALAIAERKETERRRSERRDSEMRAYAEASPDIMKRGSDTWNQAAAAYQDLVYYQGTPETAVEKANLELIAVRTVLGPVAAIKARKAADEANRANRETYNDVGNGDQHKTEQPDTQRKKLTPRQQEYFSRMQKAGRYPNGIKEYMEELSYVRPIV